MSDTNKNDFFQKAYKEAVRRQSMYKENAELKERIIELEYELRNATDLLNDCGYELIDGVWRDMEYYPDDLE